jgi:nucleoside-diphosphate-sugar epimerase
LSGADYGAAKLAAEGICPDFVGRGLDVTIIRPRTIKGPRRSEAGDPGREGLLVS